ncbi:hypothetical protein DF947_13685 [Pedobacter paludis]|uniref:Uncharacterized protein n=1 Tax=Pedobacter paludis TaxID=2203212 RepID=A0A317EXT9_9SPHI|nr:hypothetical protein DF947_13685 [Pedobacter paludis]
MRHKTNLDKIVLFLLIHVVFFQPFSAFKAIKAYLVSFRSMENFWKTKRSILSVTAVLLSAQIFFVRKKQKRISAAIRFIYKKLVQYTRVSKQMLKSISPQFHGKYP